MVFETGMGTTSGAMTQNETWLAQLAMRFTRRGEETMLVDRRHFGPLRVQRPFYPESRRICHVYLLHPPGGMVAGDQLEVDIQVDPNAWGLVTTPGAGKFYRNDGRQPACQTQRLFIAPGGVLEWLPQENILFNGVHVEMLTRVELQEGAQFIGWDITCLGRPASGEDMIQCRVRQRFELWRGTTPLWLERNRYSDHCPVLNADWGLRGHRVVATLVCTNRDHSLVDELRRNVCVTNPSFFAVTQLDEVLVCRYLGNQAQEARNCLGQAWQRIRQFLLGMKAVPPRIWKT